MHHLLWAPAVFLQAEAAVKLQCHRWVPVATVGCAVPQQCTKGSRPLCVVGM